jgi:hypothetical protein
VLLVIALLFWWFGATFSRVAGRGRAGSRTETARNALWYLRQRVGSGWKAVIRSPSRGRRT